jgi:hypothetical protein
VNSGRAASRTWVACYSAIDISWLLCTKVVVVAIVSLPLCANPGRPWTGSTARITRTVQAQRSPTVKPLANGSVGSST